MKTRTVSGNLTLMLHHQEHGSFAIAADWTDYFSDNELLSYDQDQFITADALLALCDMVKNIVK
jgi:hypothetical protein